MAQRANNVIFDAFFTASKVGKTGLIVTVDIFGPGGYVTGGGATEVAGGIYKFELTGDLTDNPGRYQAVFKTTDATVDFKHVACFIEIEDSIDQFLIRLGEVASDGTLRFTLAEDDRIQAEELAANVFNIKNTVESTSGEISLVPSTVRTELAPELAALTAVEGRLTEARAASLNKLILLQVDGDGGVVARRVVVAL